MKESFWMFAGWKFQFVGDERQAEVSEDSRDEEDGMHVGIA